MKKTDTSHKILELLSSGEFLSGAEIARQLKITRQAVNSHMKALIRSGKVVKIGKTRKARYCLKKFTETIFNEKKIKYILQTKGLAEDYVFQRASLELNLKSELNANSYEIVNYAFSEMLNNAIDHSFSEKCIVEMFLDFSDVRFIIRDFGIGVFESIMKKYGSPDEGAAAFELTKGKITTQPERHTGEGIFFTSRVADFFSLRSHRIELTFDNVRKDVFFERKKFIKGTKVTFSVSRQTSKKLSDVFSRFAPEEFDYQFSESEVYVRLLSERYVSRSIARRLLANLNKFKRITIDMKGVNVISRGFIDEITRVFKTQNPGVEIEFSNVCPELKNLFK